MKKTILVIMTAISLTISLPAHAGLFEGGSMHGEQYNSEWDYIWLSFGRSFETGFTVLANGISEENTGWRAFWDNCDNPNEHAEDCIGTVAAGIGITLLESIVGGSRSYTTPIL